jgi:hypothetical protein
MWCKLLGKLFIDLGRLHPANEGIWKGRAFIAGAQPTAQDVDPLTVEYEHPIRLETREPPLGDQALAGGVGD